MIWLRNDASHLTTITGFAVRREKGLANQAAAPPFPGGGFRGISYTVMIIQRERVLLKVTFVVFPMTVWYSRSR